MSFADQFRFAVRQLITALFGRDFYGQPVLCKVLTVVGRLLFFVGIVIFTAVWIFLGAGHKPYDYPVKLDEPQPVLHSTRLLAANGRVYVFSKEMCAVNVYDEEDGFLFCVRGRKDKNGEHEMFLSGTDIYILKWHGELLRFDENGTYLGKADEGRLYDRHGQLVVSLGVPDGARAIRPAYCDDSGIWCYVWYEDDSRVLFYSDGTTVEMIGPVELDRSLHTVKMENCIYAQGHYARTDGGALYSVRGNKILRTTDSGTSVLVKTPLWLYCSTSILFGWMGALMVAIGEAFESLAKKRFKLRQANGGQPLR